MSEATALAPDLGKAIGKLIELKTIRDNLKFTSYKLAKAINVDRSLIQRLLNGDVLNPRIDTLAKIVSFFANDGFNITFDDFVQWNTKSIEVHNQQKIIEETMELPLYLMSSFNGEKIGTVKVLTPKSSPGTIATVLDKAFEPFFRAGSIFIVDMLKTPCSDNLVLIRINGADEVTFRKYIQHDNGIITLQSYHTEDTEIEYKSEKIQLIGVIIRINLKP